MPPHVLPFPIAPFHLPCPITPPYFCPCPSHTLAAPVRRASMALHRRPAAWAPPASGVAADNVEAPVPGLQLGGGARTGMAVV